MQNLTLVMKVVRSLPQVVRDSQDAIAWILVARRSHQVRHTPSQALQEVLLMTIHRRMAWEPPVRAQELLEHEGEPIPFRPERGDSVHCQAGGNDLEGKTMTVAGRFQREQRSSSGSDFGECS